MKEIKKIGAIVIAIMMIAMVGVAYATTDLGGSEQGVVGGSDTFVFDNPTTQDKLVNIKKELTAYNVDETTINAPTVSYMYTITAGASGINITDASTDHENSIAVTVQTKAGVIPNVRVTGSADGRANTPATAGSADTSVANTVSWSTSSTLTASTAGTANYQNIIIDFTNVVFGAAGVYRYVITETPPTYAASGVTETTNTTNPHVRYLDVYVRPVSSGFTNGTVAADWDIYGYVCMLESEEITDAGDTATTGAVKTNGFVAGSNDGTGYPADSYYTYNVTVSKAVTNDNYAKTTHAFPFTVIFTNSTITQPVDISVTSNLDTYTTGTVGGFTDPSSAALSAGTTKGIVTLKDSSSIKYVGIPAGTTIEVYETNDMPGVTYQVTTTVDGTTSTSDDTVDASVVSGSTPTSATAQDSNKNGYESTKATFTPTVNTDDDVAHTIAVDNNLQVISPTGYVSRYAPYGLILIGGVALLVIAMKKRKHTEED